MNEEQLLPVEAISQRILIIRGVKVMLDADLAELYGVATKNLNKAVKRNLLRFPDDFMFQLTSNEVMMMNRSQIVTGSSGVDNNRFQIGTGPQKHRNLKFLPYAFTEHGVAMLSAVLKSDRAIEMSVFIVRAFVRLREILASNKELAYKVEEIEREQKTQNRHINAIYRILDKFIAEPTKPKEPIGFRLPTK